MTQLPESQLRVRAPTPPWFDWALAQVFESRHVEVAGCPIHYLRWHSPAGAKPRRGLIFVHGGAAHAHWWRFTAPFFAADFRVVAIDLSGMGDSGTREAYSAALRAAEIRALITHADLGQRPFVVGHSFGGFMTMRLAVDHGAELGGAVIVDSPVRKPDDPPPDRAQRVFAVTRTYPSFDDALARFRLLPDQPCENPFALEFIARHSIKAVAEEWRWKFDPHAMGAKRWREPFHEHMQNMACRGALIYGQESALVNADKAAYMSGLMGPSAPIIAIPQARHHVMLDQPLAFVTGLRSLLECWQRGE